MASHSQAEQQPARLRAGRLTWPPGWPHTVARRAGRYAGPAARALLLTGLVAAIYGLDRELHELPSTTWVAYVLPVLLAPRLMPAPLAMTFIATTIVLAWTDALAVASPTWVEAPRPVSYSWWASTRSATCSGSAH
jgi:hypothetical protein